MGQQVMALDKQGTVLRMVRFRRAGLCWVATVSSVCLHRTQHTDPPTAGEGWTKISALERALAAWVRQAENAAQAERARRRAIERSPDGAGNAAVGIDPSEK
jgi:hypothetical protein